MGNKFKMNTLLETFDLPFANHYVNEFVLKRIEGEKKNFRVTFTCDFETDDILKKFLDFESAKLFLGQVEVGCEVKQNIYKKVEFVLMCETVYERNMVSKTGYMIKVNSSSGEEVRLTFNGNVKVEVEKVEENKIESGKSCTIV